MSLRAFHLFFITICILLTVGVAAWSFDRYRATGDVATLLLGLASLPAGIGLVAYAGWVRRKLSRISALALAFLVANAAEACPVCFGDPDSALVKGTADGVLFLVGVVGVVLGAIAWTGFTWMRRARQLELEGKSF